MRRFTMAGRVFNTRFLRLRKITSMGNFIPNVWTPSQGAIHNPSPGSRPECFSKPVRRVALVFAISARSASTRPLVWFETRSLANVVRSLVHLRTQHSSIISSESVRISVSYLETGLQLKYFLRSLFVASLLGGLRLAQAQATFGDVVRLGATPSDIVLDESRSRYYLVNSST